MLELANLRPQSSRNIRVTQVPENSNRTKLIVRLEPKFSDSNMFYSKQETKTNEQIHMQITKTHQNKTKKEENLISLTSESHDCWNHR